jgi:hypothetical protein
VWPLACDDSIELEHSELTRVVEYDTRASLSSAIADKLGADREDNFGPIESIQRVASPARSRALIAGWPSAPTQSQRSNIV